MKSIHINNITHEKRIFCNCGTEMKFKRWASLHESIKNIYECPKCHKKVEYKNLIDEQIYFKDM
jgi:ribosomal protein L37AE/L43A